MSEATDARTGSTGTWAVLDNEGWETGDDLLIRLTDALAGIGPEDGTALYDHVAVDAVLDALEPDSSSRGVSEIRFDYDRYEVMITRGGVIAATPDPDSASLSSD